MPPEEPALSAVREALLDTDVCDEHDAHRVLGLRRAHCIFEPMASEVENPQRLRSRLPPERLRAALGQPLVALGIECLATSPDFQAVGVAFGKASHDWLIPTVAVPPLREHARATLEVRTLRLRPGNMQAPRSVSRGQFPGKPRCL